MLHTTWFPQTEENNFNLQLFIHSFIFFSISDHRWERERGGIVNKLGAPSLWPCARSKLRLVNHILTWPSRSFKLISVWVPGGYPPRQYSSFRKGLTGVIARRLRGESAERLEQFLNVFRNSMLSTTLCHISSGVGIRINILD